MARMSDASCDRCGTEFPLIAKDSAAARICKGSIGLIKPSIRYWQTWRPDMKRILTFCEKCNETHDMTAWKPGQLSL